MVPLTGYAFTSEDLCATINLALPLPGVKEIFKSVHAPCVINIFED